MVSIMCAYCERFSNTTVHWANRTTLPGASVVHLQGVVTCHNCGGASLGDATQYPNTGGETKNVFGNTSGSNFTWYPRTGASPEFADVPDHIARAAKEAHANESINSHMSAILMARTVVEATAKAKGITTGSLYAKIDALAAQNFIRKDTKEAAHEIRHLGNDTAHGDIDDVPEAGDVRDVLVLMDEILSEVFQGPARTARLRGRRTGPST